MRYGIGRAGLDAIAAEDATRIIDIVDARIAFSGGNALNIGVFGGFDIDATRGTGCGAQEAAHAFFQAVFIPVQDVNTTIASLKMDGFFGIIFGDGFPQHIAKRHAKTLDQGC